MARITTEEQIKIQTLAAQGTKVSELAQTYDCSTANIYAILKKNKPLDKKDNLNSDISDKESDKAIILNDGVRQPEKIISSDVFDKDNNIHMSVVETAENTHDSELPQTNQLKNDHNLNSDGLKLVEFSDVEALPSLKFFESSDEEALPNLKFSNTQTHPETQLETNGSIVRNDVQLKVEIEKTDKNDVSVRARPKMGKSGSATGSRTSALKKSMALFMKTSDGDETVTPFKSLEDLLAGVKPILRTASKSKEAVWFSIQEYEDDGELEF